MEIRDVKYVVTLSSNVWEGCHECNDRLPDSPADAANHYIREHGYTLLHVGAEAARSGEGQLIHHTVCIVGTDAENAGEHRRAMLSGELGAVIIEEITSGEDV